MKSLLRKNGTIARGYHALRLLRQLPQREGYLRHYRNLLSQKTPDLEQISLLALAPVSWQRETFRCNELYAHDLVIKSFLGVDFGRRLKVLVEHGCVYTEALIENPLTTPLAKRNIVMSRARASFLGTRNIPAIPIGPYIHYAEPVFDPGRIQSLKGELGRTLLFFPSHSTQEISVEDSYAEIDALLSDLKKNHSFDSILICGYFMDIERGLFDHIGRKEGYHFVSCGHRLGPLFQQLLKTYLLLADVVASNAVGTQTGYALFLGKPFWVLGSQHIISYYKGDAAKVAEEVEGNGQPILAPYADLSFRGLEDLFRNKETSIDPKVLELVGCLWGFGDLVGREELARAVF